MNRLSTTTTTTTLPWKWNVLHNKSRRWWLSCWSSSSSSGSSGISRSRNGCAAVSLCTFITTGIPSSSYVIRSVNRWSRSSYHTARTIGIPQRQQQQLQHLTLPKMTPVGRRNTTTIPVLLVPNALRHFSNGGGGGIYSTLTAATTTLCHRQLYQQHHRMISRMSRCCNPNTTVVTMNIRNRIMKVSSQQQQQRQPALLLTYLPRQRRVPHPVTVVERHHNTSAATSTTDTATTGTGTGTGSAITIVNPTITTTTITAIPALVTNPYHPIGQWLLGVAGMVVAMISIGGITRLTQSGLSMTSWTLTGKFPPMTTDQWQKEFQIYQQFPEFQQRNQMTLSEFKYIYFWEYAHRMMGRVIGLAYVAPYMYFTVRKQIPTSYHPRFVFIGTLGLLQGFIGWWMVQSGLSPDRHGDTHEIRVKPLRLATHLTMAITTYSLLLYTALEMFRYPMIVSSVAHQQLPPPPPSKQSMATMMNQQSLLPLLRTLSRSSFGVLTLTIITIVSGALVAGNDAGRAYNTFPKMDDEYFPSNYFGGHDDEIDTDADNNNEPNDNNNNSTIWNDLSLLQLRNFYENTATVQFNHRLCGISTAISGIAVSMVGLYRIYPQFLLQLQQPASSTATTVGGSSKVMMLGNIITTPTMVAVKGLVPYLRHGLMAIGLAVTGQFTLGVTTLLWYVPISLAALHQLGSIVVLSSSIYVLHTARTISKAIGGGTVSVGPTAAAAAAVVRSNAVAVATTTTRTNAATNSVLTNPVLLRNLSSATKQL